MNIAADELKARHVRLQEVLRGSPRSSHAQAEASHALIASAIELARHALQTGHAELAVETLELLVSCAPRQALAWQLLGFAYAEEQRIPEAARALAEAAALEPREPVTAMALAQATLDAGLPAVHLFENVKNLSPDDLATVKGWAASLTMQGQSDAAEVLLADTLRQHPAWLVGHKMLTALRFTTGDTRDFDRSYAEACGAQPQNMSLRLAWFGAIAQGRDWDKALQILAVGERVFGAAPALATARAFVAGESGDHARAEELFSRAQSQRDDVLQMAYMRHCLRTRQIDKAERLALELMNGPLASSLWPYLSLIWRLQGDPRAQWLDGAPPFIRAFDLDYSAGELDELAAVLRKLHTARRPFADQSVRGGTQTDTDRQLFFRAEPEIQQVRAKVCEAVREYVAGLPETVPGHPLLGPPRGRVLFSGSWSVRLTGRGYHVSHTHPMGWISSALYIALPDNVSAEPAGWISLGAPPVGFGLSLPPYARFKPEPGRLILFPSTMWHETLPFEEGERLVIAFDVMKPRASRVP